MSKVRPESTNDSSIQIKVDIDIAAGGRSEIGGEPGPKIHRFRRITQDNVKVGDWLINPTTNETHKVLDLDDNVLTILTKSGGQRTTIDTVKDLLLLVESK